MADFKQKSKADFKIGQEVVLDGGKRQIHGSVVKLNPVKILIKATDGRLYNAPYSIVFAKGEEKGATSMPPMSYVYAGPQMVARSADGTAYLIVKANKSRYTAVNLSSNKSVYVPYSMIVSAEPGVPFLMNLMKERGVPLKAREGLVQLIMSTAL